MKSSSLFEDFSTSLFDALDPKLISFIRQRHKNSNETAAAPTLPSREPMDTNKSDSAATDLPIDVDSRWLHMDKIEQEKLEWMKELPKPTAQRTGDDAVSSFSFLNRFESFARRIPKVFRLDSISKAISSHATLMSRSPLLFTIMAKNRMPLVTHWTNCFICHGQRFSNNASSPFKLSFILFDR